MEDDTIVRVFGFEDSPFIFPKTVLDRIAYLEIVRQMDFSSFMNFGSLRKHTFMPSTLWFGDFIVLAKE